MKTISEQLKEKYSEKNKAFEMSVLENPPKTEFYSRHVKLLSHHQVKTVKSSIIKMRISETLLYCEFGEASESSSLANVDNVIFAASNFHFSSDGDLVCRIAPIGGKEKLGLAIINDESLFNSLRFSPVYHKNNKWYSLSSVVVSV